MKSHNSIEFHNSMKSKTTENEGRQEKENPSQIFPEFSKYFMGISIKNRIFRIIFALLLKSLENQENPAIPTRNSQFSLSGSTKNSQKNLLGSTLNCRPVVFQGNLPFPALIPTFPEGFSRGIFFPHLDQLRQGKSGSEQDEAGKSQKIPAWIPRHLLLPPGIFHLLPRLEFFWDFGKSPGLAFPAALSEREQRWEPLIN